MIFKLGIGEFQFSDLYSPIKLKELAEKFYGDLQNQNAELHEVLINYIAAGGKNYDKKIESKILTDAAPYLSNFVERLFHIETENQRLQKSILEQSPIWKYKFFVQRRAIKKFPEAAALELNESEINYAYNELRNKIFSDTLIHDDELAISTIATQLLEAEELLSKPQELTLAVEKTIKLILDGYEKLKDSVFVSGFFMNRSRLQSCRMSCLALMYRFRQTGQSTRNTCPISSGNGGKHRM